MQITHTDDTSLFTRLGYALAWIASGAVCLLVAAGPHRQLYISDNIVWLVMLGAIFALVVGLFQLVAALGQRAGERGHFRLPMLISAFIFVLPIVLALAVPPHAFGAATLHHSNGNSAVASQTGASAGPVISVEQAYREADSKGIWTPSLTDILIGLENDQATTVNRPLTTLGFVYREQDMPANYFAVMRYATVHCSAEARPVGLLVTAPNAANFAEDSWVWITGKVEITNINGRQNAQIVADSIQLAEEPAGPYIFYSYTARK